MKWPPPKHSYFRVLPLLLRRMMAKEKEKETGANVKAGIPCANAPEISIMAECLFVCAYSYQSAYITHLRVCIFSLHIYSNLSMYLSVYTSMHVCVFSLSLHIYPSFIPICMLVYPFPPSSSEKYWKLDSLSARSVGNSHRKCLWVFLYAALAGRERDLLWFARW